MVKKVIEEKKLFPLGKILPAMITLASVVAGLTAILLASRGNFEKAVIAVMLAAVFDGFDGRVARMFKTSSQFGVELDSLADSISFGVAPAFILFFFSAYEIKSIGWLSAVIYAICCVLRLARFNTMTGDENIPQYWKSFFTGIPAPGGALLATIPLSLYLATGEEIFTNPSFSICFMLIVGFLMISRVPTLSLKKIKLTREEIAPVMILFIIALVLLYFHFWYTISVISILYLLTIPVTVLKFVKARKDFQA
ncbi:MAG: CDP-diacylglycerol--serine O-phosphatidyltransferase [Alphaproteobacteria bacterium]